MRRPTSAFVTTSLATVLGIVSVPHAGSAQSINPAQMSAAQLSTPDIPVPPYNPYPPLPGATRLPFSRPTYSPRYTGSGPKSRRSSVAISRSGRH